MNYKSRFFKPSEFACKCGCGKADVSEDLLKKLDDLRGLIGRPVVIVSGFRCDRHNTKVGGVPGSAHTLGLAVDILAANSRARFEVLSQAVHLFERIGIGKSFIHVDIDETKPQEVAWLYGE
jgi:zinc D-Ala-D-Ala carboxypeptidase